AARANGMKEPLDDRNEGEVSGPDRLRRLVAETSPEAPLVLVANREPYLHEKREDAIVVRRPASGLVTGVEPLLKACGGVWIAHGSGSADRLVTGADGRIRVPPENPEYTLRRMWLSQAEQEGYYFGFANEALWPLCHIAHTRPAFRRDDFEHYERVNRRFAVAAAEEAGQDGIVLVQDYHYALLPRQLREIAPRTAISLFWHIPWPNEEIFGICPWKEALLEGMLGADVVGFQTRYHCLNFLETVQRTLECKVDFETMSVDYQQHRTSVRPYPISIALPVETATREEGRGLKSSLGIPADAHVALGIDRADYTKGLPERIDAIEVLLNEYPELRGRFVYVQLASPSRTHIKAYREHNSRLEEAVTRVNRRFGSDDWVPIQFLLKNVPLRVVRQYYAMADSAIVTPLHDGMNLVAKEYVASCVDGHGALVLSRFTGAARELEGALLVNPYDAYEVATAIHHALVMEEPEREERMQSMRNALASHTIYDWAAELLTDMADVWKRRRLQWADEPIRS
ncbi:MAG TPA: trehalose-6-phosphate synthase, partial [Thermoanaerobaculia bacterium]|nr:trehalose-6-phosphate synthase [Thermoanaerobaculia bacterium]